MAQKPTAKKKSPPRSKKSSARGTGLQIGEMKGGVTARIIKGGRDVNIYQVTDAREQTANIATPEQFLARAQEAQTQLAALKRQPALTPAQAQAVEVAEGQVKQVIQEAQKPKPLAARISATLTGAKAIMENLGSGVKAALELGKGLGELAIIALKVFGGS